MAARRSADPAKTRAAVAVVGAWLRDGNENEPARSQLADAVRPTATTLADIAPGASVEVRVPPFVAAQCIPAPPPRAAIRPTSSRPTRAPGGRRRPVSRRFADATASGALRLSGARAREIAHWLPLVALS